MLTIKHFWQRFTKDLKEAIDTGAIAKDQAFIKR